MRRREALVGLAAAGTGLLGGGAMGEGRLSWQRREGNLQVLDQGRPVLEYCREPRTGPPGTGPLFARSGYLHPIHAPCGAVATDDFAADHPHQRGVFFAWTKTKVVLDGEELTPDFWNLGSGTGRVRSTGWDTPEALTEGLRFRTRQTWDLRRGGEWQAALHETWQITLHTPTFADPQDPHAAYVLDLVSRQTPRVRLELPDYRYGGMAVRGSREWIPKASGVQVLASGDRGRVEADGARSHWCALSGPVGGKELGIVLLDHPGNARHPNPLRVHPDVPYFVFSPPKGADWVLEANQEQVFRYRLVVCNGLVTAPRGDGWWEQYRQPRG